jgi:hypothetical protein
VNRAADRYSPNRYEVYTGLEAGAASIRNFEPVIVPGLLQTEDYAREIFRNGRENRTLMTSSAAWRSASPVRRC